MIDSKRWKRWDSNLLIKTNSQPSNKDEIDQLIADIKIPVPSNAQQDKRICIFCNDIGDMKNNGPGRYDLIL